RLALVGLAAAVTLGGVRGMSDPFRERAAMAPIRLGRGPHLFLDERLIETSANVARRVNRPTRALATPVMTAGEDGNFQPYVTVIRDGATGRFRAWYNTPVDASRSHLATMSSADGIQWERPHRVLEDPAPIQFGASVIDEGPGA